MFKECFMTFHKVVLHKELPVVKFILASKWEKKQKFTRRNAGDSRASVNAPTRHGRARTGGRAATSSAAPRPLGLTCPWGSPAPAAYLLQHQFP